MPEQRFPYDGPPELQAPITQALERVVDPEVALNIVDVGLVYGVRVADGVVNVNVTMTSAACPVTDTIVEEMERELDRRVPEGLKIHIDLVWEPPWTPERLSAKARLFMGW